MAHSITEIVNDMCAAREALSIDKWLSTKDQRRRHDFSKGGEDAFVLADQYKCISTPRSLSIGGG